MAHIFDVGTRAWQPDTAEGWVASEVTDKQVAGDQVTLVFTLENGEVRNTMPLEEEGDKERQGSWQSIADFVPYRPRAL